MKRAVLYLRVSTLDQTTANQEREAHITQDGFDGLLKSTTVS
jgi:DNA invertase Pin-like site-specific DNA recombinase